MRKTAFISKLVIFLLCFLAQFASSAQAQQPGEAQLIAKVMEVHNHEAISEFESLNQDVKLVVLSDCDIKGKVLWLKNKVPDNPAFAIVAKLNKKYFIGYDDSSDSFFIKDYYREPVIIILLLAFVLLLLILGKIYGLKSLISLCLTGIAIVFVFIPGIKNGANPISLAVLVASFATASTMLLVAGFSRKSFAATLGTIGGVSVGAVIAYFVIELAPLSGMASTEANILNANLNFGAQNNMPLDFKGILAAGIIIACLGAAMDVAISIASTAKELKEAKPEITNNQLFHQSMNVGRDIMGTMTNTLILAYTGSSIPLLLLLFNEQGLPLLNMEIIATEIVSAITGSIALLLAIPITAFSASLLYKSN